jgi:Holliday junction DNA helicase RuvA
MIGRLRGVLSEKQPPWLLLDVSGVGYEVEAPMSTFFVLPAIGTEVSLFTHLVVREDAQLLYGFWAQTERRLFRELIRVSGIGPRVALAILSGMDAAEFARCVQNEDSAALTRVPGIGKKTAERLLVEMRDRLKDWKLAPASLDGSSPVPTSNADSASADAASALVALGYKPAEVDRLIKKHATPDISTEQLIRTVLKQG